MCATVKSRFNSATIATVWGFLFLFTLQTALPAQTTSTLRAAPRPNLFNFVSISTSTAVRATAGHDFNFNLKTGAMRVNRAEAKIDPLAVELFGGTSQTHGIIKFNDDRTTDANLSITLDRINVLQAMRDLQLPRAGEIEGLAAGTLDIEMRNGRFTRADVRIQVLDKTALISRDLLSMVLGFALRDDLMDLYNKTMDQNFGQARMIPLSGLTVTGRLENKLLILKIPIQNGALDSTLEPRIEEPLLWNAWNFLTNQLQQAARGKLMNLRSDSR